MNPEREPQLNTPENPEDLMPKRLDDEEAERIFCVKMGILRNEYDDYVEMLGSEMMNDWRNKTDIVRGLSRLLLELKEKITDYDTILCDDTSGRLPSRFLKYLMDAKHEQENKNPIRLKFVASGKTNNPDFDKIHEFVKAKKEEENWGKVLIVTDHIFTGKSMEKLTDILEEENIDFDIASVTVWREKRDPGYQFDPCQNPKILKRLYFGDSVSEFDAERPPFYYLPYLTGVTKDPNDRLGSPHSVPSGLSPAHLNRARKDMKMLAEELYKLVE